MTLDNAANWTDQACERHGAAASHLIDESNAAFDQGKHQTANHLADQADFHLGMAWYFATQGTKATLDQADG